MCSVRTVHMERACLQREEEQRVRELGEDGASQRLLQHREQHDWYTGSVAKGARRHSAESEALCGRAGGRRGLVSCRAVGGLGRGGRHTPGGFTMRAVRQPSSTPSRRWTAGSKRSGQA